MSQEPFRNVIPGEPKLFMQWKGTDVCMDFHCECGRHGHYHGDFAYFIRCVGCGQLWELPWHIYPRKVDSTDGASALEPMPDH